MSGPKQWKVGDYAIGRTSPVRLSSEVHPGRFEIEFVSNYEHGAGICCGGYCSAYGVNELKPVTKPEDFILCAAYEAMKRIAAAKAEIIQQEKVLAANTAALAAYSKARDAAAAVAEVEV